MQVVNLITPELNIRESDISIIRRLPAAEGITKPIIVKFVRRDNGDEIYRENENLNSKSAIGIGFQQNSRLYINKSLTVKSRATLTNSKNSKDQHGKGKSI